MGDLARALDDDSLLEILRRCDADDFIALMHTCKYMHNLIVSSSLLWESKLWEDFGWEPARITSNNISTAVSETVPNYRDIYYSFRSKADCECIRFRGLYTNGGIDGGNREYWVDNAFRGDHSPYCSHSSSNVDIVAVLLKDNEEKITLEQNTRMFMRERCYLAAEWLVNLNQRRGQNSQVQENFFSIDQLNDLQLKHFFCSLFESYSQGSPLGHFLFIDVGENLEEEERRVRETVFLLQRQQEERNRSVINPRLNLMYDKYVLNQIKNGSLESCSLNAIEIGRMGQLTCPVMSGVIFGCRLDSHTAFSRREDILNELDDSMKFLNVFAQLDCTEILMENSNRGTVPQIEQCSIMKSNSTIGGCFIEFKRKKRMTGRHLFDWSPIGWFSFDPTVSRKIMESQYSYQLKEIEYTESEERDTHSESAIRNRILGTLRGKLAVNFLTVKLIDQDNLMEQMLDGHDQPNIDLSMVKVSGKVLRHL